ncbi:hypothetical protein IF1G_04831 [Cordyceps javanica]|uniref:Uncharacterized protein n=1 Tax=Cordyceps javanica TaxID=43265 RepID=A0A545V3F6_9HYPO|nr:hypothetical protein IF1G_04831 [Cordyceps javanica]
MRNEEHGCVAFMSGWRLSCGWRGLAYLATGNWHLDSSWCGSGSDREKRWARDANQLLFDAPHGTIPYLRRAAR